MAENWKNCKRPFIELRKSDFFHERGRKVQIAGDFTDWKPRQLKFRKNGRKLEAFQFLRFQFAPRVEYKLIVDGKWIIDPLNPNKVDNGVGGENSFFTMPEYKATEWDNVVELTKLRLQH